MITITCDICGSTADDVKPCILVMKHYCTTCDQAFHKIWTPIGEELQKLFISRIEETIQKVKANLPTTDPSKVTRIH